MRSFLAHLGLACLSCVILVVPGAAQDDMIPVLDSIFQAADDNDSLDNSEENFIFDSLARQYALAGDICGEIRSRQNQASALEGLGMPDSALSQLLWTEANFNSNCDTVLLYDLYVRYTNVYLSLGDLAAVDSSANAFLRIWHPATEGDWVYWYAVHSNVAIARAQEGNLDSSAMVFRQVYEEARKNDDRKYVMRSLTNLGTLKGIEGDLDSAYFFLTAAAFEARELNDTYGLMPLLINLANLDMERGLYEESEAWLDSAYNVAERADEAEMMISVYNSMAYLRELEGDYVDAYDFLRAYAEGREEYLNEQRIMAVAEMRQKYEAERKQRRIQELELEKLDSEIENTRIRSARNRIMFLGGFVLLIAVGLWSRLRYVRRSREAIQKEKDISDGLLLNILPATVAEELKEKGRTDAKYYDTATIMFSDFKNFTDTASDVSAEILVESINVYFQAFDDIITRNGIEKIKTIGDAYMAAGGIDEMKPVKAADVVNTALEMCEFVEEQKQMREKEGKVTFDVRLGVHSGPVVAGIVGVKKFQYDLWGDTVNIASRMETNGVAGRVNISEKTYELVKDDPRFEFEARGQINVKGKGDMVMYFVTRAKPV